MMKFPIAFFLSICAAAQPQDKRVELPGGSALQLRFVPPGSFWRGSPDVEPGRDRDEGPRHEVRLTRGFYLGIHEVTQRQWVALMDHNPSVFQQEAEDAAADRPVDSVSYHQAEEFLRRLNRLGLGRFRLPTEAEWEYAARAGTSSAYYWGDGAKPFDTYTYAWANSRSMARTHAVGTKKPNAWGFHDMAGNVWEWCSDWYGPYAEGLQTDPQGPARGAEKVFRGGSYYDFPPALRVANRHRHGLDRGYTAIGLRVVLEAEPWQTRTVRLAETALQFVQVPAGRFLMGSPETEAGRARDESPQIEQEIPRSFWLGQFEVTQKQWHAVMGSNPSVFRGEDLPVEMVSWDDIQQFLLKVNAMGLGRFRLPTEAEWEYAARAGSTARFSFGDDANYQSLPDYAWFYSRAEGATHPVGTRKPNPWGLYDIYGNVWEWCADAYSPALDQPRNDPGRIIRGGSWFNEPEALRAANRHRHAPDSRQTNIGFRLVWEPI